MQKRLCSIYFTTCLAKKNDANCAYNVTRYSCHATCLAKKSRKQNRRKSVKRHIHAVLKECGEISCKSHEEICCIVKFKIKNKPSVALGVLHVKIARATYNNSFFARQTAPLI